MLELINRIKREAHIRTPFQMLNGTTAQRTKALQFICEELANPLGITLVTTQHGIQYLSLQDERTIAISLGVNPRNLTMLWACRAIAIEEAIYDVVKGATPEVAANHRDVWRAGFLEWEYCGDDRTSDTYTRRDGFIRGPKGIVTTRGKGKHAELWHSFLTGFQDALVQMMFWKPMARATVSLFDRIDHHLLEGLHMLRCSGWIQDPNAPAGRGICKAVTPHTTVSLDVETKRTRDVRWQISPAHVVPEVKVNELTHSLKPYVTTTSEQEIGLADCLIEDIGSLLSVLPTLRAFPVVCSKIGKESKRLSDRMTGEWLQHAELYRIDGY